MRSKEVEKAKERLKNGKFTAYIGSKTAIYFIEDVETVLAYIETLEKLPNKIRDKIKYYEDEIEYASPCGGWEREYKYAIEVLKEILGE